MKLFHKISTMRIFVNSTASPSYQTIDISLSDTVRQLKAYIEQTQSIAIEDQFLTFGCKPLSDALDISSYGVQDWSTIHLSVRVRGGSETQVHPKGNTSDRLYLRDNQSVSSDSPIQQEQQVQSISLNGSENIENLKKIFLEGSKERVKKAQIQFEKIGEHEGCPYKLYVSTKL